MQHVRDLLRHLANFDPDDAFVLSVYLDMRPHGDSPAIRPALIVLTDRFRKIEKTLLPHGAALDNFRLDANRAQHYLDEHAGPRLQSVALFACNRLNLFEVIETGVPFENQVALEPVPDLFQLARLVDEQETAVVALLDTNTTRLFVTRSGFLEEVAGPTMTPLALANETRVDSITSSTSVACRTNARPLHAKPPPHWRNWWPGRELHW